MGRREQFADRADAGRQLARVLEALGEPDPVVLALPRGGVPVAVEVATVLAAPLDLVMVRKIGVPGHPELAAAAVVDGAAPHIEVNAAIAELAGLNRAGVERLAQVELDEIERRRTVYLAGCHPVPVEGRTAILVDDGIATGATMRAAIAAVKRRRPARLIVAAPVAAHDTCREIARQVDAVVTLLRPTDLQAVGLYYGDFHQVSDAEVVEMLSAGAGAGTRNAR